MEAFFSLLAALLLLSFIPLTYDSQEFSRASLLEYQHANDVAEVLWAAGDYEKIGDWAEGDEASGYVVRERLGGIAKETNLCIVLEVKGKNKKIEVNCGETGNEVTVISRTIVGKEGIYEMMISVS